jgi:Tol biopolymer transport system component
VMFDADGHRLATLPLPRDPNVDDSHVLIAPAWSPDGTRFAYTTVDSEGGSYQLRIHVATIDPAGSLVDDKRFEYDANDSDEGWAAWSPDGTRFVLNTGVRGADFWRVAVANSDGTGKLVYTGPPTTTPQAMEHRWSPDGKTIMARYWEEFQAWLLDPAGGPGQQVPFWATSDDAPTWQRVARG